MDITVIDGQAPPDDSKDGIQPKMPPVRDEMIARQVNTLLAINNSSIANLAMLHNTEFEGASDYTRKEGGALEAIEQTVIATQARLQSLLNSESCWNLQERQTLEQHSIEVFELKKQSLRMGMAPHVRFKPHFQWVPDIKKFICWIGDLSDENGRILGTGDTIEQALEAYDLEFRAERKNRRIATPPFGQTNQIHEQNEARMDGTRNPEPSGDAEGKGNPSGDGKSPRRKPRGG